jgi:predicted DNA-binding helix-hairpin-helix protein
VRQQRLYQVWFLLRKYGFTLAEIELDQKGNLPLSIDPKLAYAKRFLIDHPVEINSASPSELMRIPGIGAKTAQRIIQHRLFANIDNLSTLGRMGIDIQRASAFLLLNGRKPSRQLTFWSAGL